MRDVNWLVPLRDGEQLSYSVSVIQGGQQESDDAPHPNASSSGLHDEGLVQAQEVDDMEDERDADTSTLPVTGWRAAPNLEAESDRSRPAKDFDVDEFVRSPLGVKFFREWLQGKVTCRLVGHRFGYPVLGKFYAIKDEMCHVKLEGVRPEDVEEVARTRVTTEGWAASVNEAQPEGNTEPVGLVTRDERPQDERGEETKGLDPAEDLQQEHVHEGDTVLVPEPGVVSAAEVLSQLEDSLEDQGREVNAESAGSKQTNLMHWLK